MQDEERLKDRLSVMPSVRDGRRIRILFVGDDAAEGEALREILQKARNAPIEMSFAGPLSSAWTLPSDRKIDVVLADFGPAPRPAVDFLEQIRARAPAIPVIALIDFHDPACTDRLMRGGAQDCLVKEECTAPLLDRAIRYAIEREKLRAALRFQARDLRLSERRLKTLIAEVSDGILIVDSEGIIRFANRAACILFGREREGIVGDRFPAGTLQDEITEIEIPVSPRLTKTAEVRVAETEWEGRPASLVSLHDITRRKITEEALRESERQSRTIIETATDAFVAMDSCGLITDWNRRAEKIFGIARPNAIGRSFAETILPPEYRDMYISEIGSFMATGRQPCLREHMELTGRRCDGSTFPIAIKIWPVRTGETYRFNAFIEDISERKKLQRLKDEFIHTVSHELRTPLTTMREGITQIAEGLLGETTPEQDEFLGIIVEDIDRLTRIINDLLDLSKIDAEMVSLRIRPVDFAEIVEGIRVAFQPRAREKGLDIRITCSRPSVVAYADPDKMIQVFTNLVGNAVKFTDRGHIEIRVQASGEDLECSVSDTGRGIPESERPHIFDKFRQFGKMENPREKGTGLGLYIVKKIIELHSGTIRVEGRPEGGTRFTFTLPRHEA
jgi:PAS domain S-box-containing protein